MLGKIINNLKRIDWLLFVNVFLLVLFGLAAIYSTTLNVGEASIYNFAKQLIFFGVGLLFLFIFAFFDFRWFSSFYKFIYFLCLVALVLVLIFGKTLRGTTAWFGLGQLVIQPVEFIKIGFVIFLAKYLSDHAKEFVFLRHFFFTGLLTLLIVILIGLQPDLGSALIFIAIWLGMLYFTNLPKKYFLYLFVFILILAVLCWFFILQTYQKDRILNLLDPSRDPLGTGYNVHQSLIAIGSGQFFGRGLGLGSQSQLNFLPEQQTDFIFSVIAEELGFVGAMAVIVFFFLFFYRLIRIMKNSYDNFGNFLLLGFFLSLFAQFLINIGMNISLTPVVGVPLPFLSLGGSSLIASLIIVGIIQSIIRINKESYF